MNTFTSCGFHWYPWPADGKCPCDPDQIVRVLTRDERARKTPYNSGYLHSAGWVPWKLSNAGWYPVNPDGTEITPIPYTQQPHVSLTNVSNSKFAKHMKTTAEIIFETIQFYLADLSRRAKRDNNTCFYADPTYPGTYCAVGRCMTPEALSEVGSSKGSVCILDDTYDLDTLLQEPYRGHPLGFWSALQSLHDSDYYWIGPEAHFYRHNWFLANYPHLLMDAQLLRLV